MGCTNATNRVGGGGGAGRRGGVEAGWGGFVSANEGGSLGVGSLLREDPQHEVPLAVGLEGGGHHDVLPGRQPQARADLPQVDELLGARAGRVGQEEVALQVDPRAPHVLLGWERGKRRGGSGAALSCGVREAVVRLGGSEEAAYEPRGEPEGEGGEMGGEDGGCGGVGGRTDGATGRRTGKQAGTGRDGQTDRQADRQGQADGQGQTGRQAGTDRQARS